ncbi:MAG: hypothetical protein RLN70_02100 [Rhodospirillaceae bacterium]
MAKQKGLDPRLMSLMREKLGKYGEPRFVAACALWATYIFIFIQLPGWLQEHRDWFSFSSVMGLPVWANVAVILIAMALVLGTAPLTVFVAHRISGRVFNWGTALIVAAVVWVFAVDQPFQTFWYYFRVAVTDLAEIYFGV